MQIMTREIKPGKWRAYYRHDNGKFNVVKSGYGPINYTTKEYAIQAAEYEATKES